MRRSEERIAKQFFFEESLKSKRMTLTRTIHDHYASLLLYEMSPCSGKSKSLSVKLDLQLITRNSLVVMHTSARCQALSLPSINYGRIRIMRPCEHCRACTREQITQINGDKRLNDISTQDGRLAKNCRQHR